jgi:hypothetical protein
MGEHFICYRKNASILPEFALPGLKQNRNPAESTPVKLICGGTKRRMPRIVRLFGSR